MPLILIFPSFLFTKLPYALSCSGLTAIIMPIAKTSHGAIFFNA
jgi:hypothetical protein